MLQITESQLDSCKKELQDSESNFNNYKTMVGKDKGLDYILKSERNENHSTISFNKKISVTEQIKLIHEIVTQGGLEISVLNKPEGNTALIVILDDKNKDCLTCYLDLDFTILTCKNFDDIIKFREIIINFITKG